MRATVCSRTDEYLVRFDRFESVQPVNGAASLSREEVEEDRGTRGPLSRRSGWTLKNIRSRSVTLGDYNATDPKN